MGLKLFSNDDTPDAAIRKVILQHEDTFRRQVFELHRLYWTQRNLMHGFTCNGLSDFYDSWQPIAAREKCPTWSDIMFPPDHSSDFFTKLYQGGRGSLASQLPPYWNGCAWINGHLEPHALGGKENALGPAVELPLGVVDCSVGGENNLTSRAIFGGDFLNRTEIIDLDDSREMVGNEEGTIITSFGPNTPIIFDGSWYDYKQRRSCVGNVRWKGFAGPITTGPNTTNLMNQGNDFYAKNQCSHRKTTSFDLNIPPPEEHDFPVCEFNDAISVEIGGSGCFQNSTNESHLCESNTHNESSGTSYGKASVGTNLDILNFPSTHSLVESNAKISQGSRTVLENFVVSSQQSSNDYSPCPDLHTSGILPLENDGAGENMETCSATQLNDSGTEALQYFVEKRLKTTMPCSIDINQESWIDLPESREGSLELPESIPVGKQSRESNLYNLCPSACEVALEDPLFVFQKDCPALLMKKPILRDCSSEFASNLSCKDDHMVLMASVSLVHMSLVKSTLSNFGRDAEIGKMTTVNKKSSDQPQCSLDSLEQIFLSLPETPEMEHSSPLKPVEESVENSKSRYSSRSGRKLCDFQKDVLPGIVALSRHEIREDLLAFAEIARSDALNRKGATGRVCRRGRNTAFRKKRLRGW